MIGGLGGFFLPIAFGVMNDLVGIWSSCFMLLFVIALANLLWMHFAILRMDRSRHPEIKADTDLPEIMATVIDATRRSEEHTSELQSLMRISYAVFCLKKKKKKKTHSKTSYKTIIQNNANKQH